MSTVHSFSATEITAFSNCCLDESIMDGRESRHDTCRVAMTILSQLKMNELGDSCRFSLTSVFDGRQLDILQPGSFTVLPIADVVVKSHSAAAAVLDLYPYRFQEITQEIIEQIVKADDPEDLERILRRSPIKLNKPSIDAEVTKALIATKKKLTYNLHVLHALLATGDRPLECISQSVESARDLFSSLMTKDPVSGKGNFLGLIYMLHREAARSTIQSPFALRSYSSDQDLSCANLEMENEYSLLYKMGALTLKESKQNTALRKKWDLDFASLPVACGPLPSSSDREQLYKSLWDQDIAVIVEQYCRDQNSGLFPFGMLQDAHQVGPYSVARQETMQHYCRPYSLENQGLSFAEGFFVTKFTLSFNGQKKIFDHYVCITEANQSLASPQTVAAVLEHAVNSREEEKGSYLILSSSQDVRAAFSLCFAQLLNPFVDKIDLAKTLYDQDPHFPSALTKEAFILSSQAWDHYFRCSSLPSDDALNTSIDSDSSHETEDSLVLE